MNLDQIETKCFILALFIRDDGERFLLGSRAYEFVDSQLHFAANSYQNDIVEVQGNDGVMLAGQVRRGTSQAFDGYIGDQTVDRATIEQYRRDFMKFFRKNHYYKVVYVFPDGSAVQRRNGFIVEAPEVKELYQLFPKYHISMNFEDINYYLYEEDADGQEIYGESATLKIATAATGGLIWEELSQTTLTGEGTNFSLDGTVNGNPISNVQLKGDTTQQTYSGKNLFDKDNPNLLTAFVNYSVGEIQSSATAKTVYIPITGGETYTVSKMLSSRFTLGTTANAPAIGEPLINKSQNNSATVLSLATSGTAKYLCVDFYRSAEDTATIEEIINSMQIEKGSIATSYEPYTGGIPAPNPDYPQTVNTVTGRQVVTISDGGGQSQSYEVNLGKNLWNPAKIVAGYGLYNNSGTTYSNSARSYLDYTEVKPSTAYTMSGASIMVICFYDSSKTYISGISTPSASITTPSNAAYVRISIDNTVDYSQAQLEKGTATTYAPYFEPIELCKIGDYQDYIYKSGDDWYLHKATNKFTVDGTKGGYNSTSNWFYISPASYGLEVTIRGTIPMCSIFMGYDIATFRNTKTLNGISVDSVNTNPAVLIRNTAYSTSDAYKTWLTSVQPVVYYVLATPTDVQITDSSVVAQLNALAGATTYDGQTIFTVSSPNQLAILSLSTIGVGGGGVMWDEYGAEWEEGTGGGPTTITVDSIDNVYPVWTVTGPAVNPQISVLTTNTTLSYSGTVTSSQELKIDMFNKTATLNGASVVGNVSGDWVYLKPGVNRITYTTNNADAPDSTIWWQEIVG